MTDIQHAESIHPGEDVTFIYVGVDQEETPVARCGLCLALVTDTSEIGRLASALPMPSDPPVERRRIKRD